LIKFNVSSSGLEIFPIPEQKIERLAERLFQRVIPDTDSVRLMGDGLLEKTGVEPFVDTD
jgi:hypothetical protein